MDYIESNTMRIWLHVMQKRKKQVNISFSVLRKGGDYIGRTSKSATISKTRF